ncbi:MAG: ATPase [Clostridiales bacterium]|uniref:ATP synthase subunit C n=1 Tax=Clostridium sp. N3C TaxID=1776758 RepID=UPI00092E05D0|nr:ATP synthase subunit C [Clostridium sp. N3C]NLZ47580.1 ATPase [Clostridiales bacterium]SCN21419.1 V-type ATP synthase subunit K [Clostridium sp. N3C]
MTIIAILTFILVVSTISYGLIQKSREDIQGKKSLKKAMGINLSIFIPIMCGALILLVPDVVRAAGESGVTNGAGLGYIAAALSTGLATIGTGVAVGSVGSAALGAVSEDPKMLGKTLIYVGLAEGIAIYGLIISIMILSSL